MDRTTILLIVAAITFPCLLLFSNIIVCDKKDRKWTFNPFNYKCDAVYMLLICALWTLVIFLVVNSFLASGGGIESLDMNSSSGGFSSNGNGNSNTA